MLQNKNDILLCEWTFKSWKMFSTHRFWNFTLIRTLLCLSENIFLIERKCAHCMFRTKHLHSLLRGLILHFAKITNFQIMFRTKIATIDYRLCHKDNRVEFENASNWSLVYQKFYGETLNGFLQLPTYNRYVNVGILWKFLDYSVARC